MTISSLFTTDSIPDDSKTILENFDQTIQGVRPLNSKQLQQLPDNIKNLSHQLTDQRSTRRLGYMNDNIQLSSYVRYYTWWNLIRLTRLFSNLPQNTFPSDKTENIICLDLGSGPLTVVISIWLARPELRKKKLIWYCLDVSANSMALGEDIYLSIVAKTGGEPWKIIRVKGSFGTNIRQKADLVTCANMFNELDQASDMPPEFQSKKYYDQLIKYAAPHAKFILVEPGVPKAARTLSLLRERFLRDKFTVVVPCPHTNECPMNGFKAYTGSQHKWCNFAFSTEDAPTRLQKLSTQAKLPKERATLSFICITGDSNTTANNSTQKITSVDNSDKTSVLCRVTSDSFRLPGNKTGVYACSEFGLTLLKSKPQGNATKSQLTSGDLFNATLKQKNPHQKSKNQSLPIDEKSGAVIIEL